jgi:hypothetical protein
MSLWCFTDQPIKIGDEYQGYLVVNIQQKIMPSVLMYNYYARLQNLPEQPEQPEIMKQCVQLSSKEK